MALGGIGAVTPGMPTTVFLIVASYCFARSMPALGDRLLRTRLFAPYMPYVDGRTPMPRRARVTAAGLMWASIAASLAWFARTGRLSPTLLAVMLTAGLAGTLAISRYRISRS